MSFKSLVRFIYYWFPPLLLMGTIFYLSSRQSVEVAESYWLNFVFFKTLHMIEYGILYILLFRAFYSLKNKKLTLQKKLMYPIILSICYGMSDEIHQLFVPTRTGTLRDIGIDTIGILLAFQYTKHNLQIMKKFL
jgi:VanZ family protein